MPLSQKLKTFPQIFIAFSQSAQNFEHVEEKDRPYSLNISEVVDFQKNGYLNALKLLFSKTLRQSSCSRVLNTPETTMPPLLSEPSIDPRHIEIENISVSQI